MNHTGTEYQLNCLRKQDLNQNDPVSQFKIWYADAQDVIPSECLHICVLSTAELPSGKVSSRVIDLKLISNDGMFIFFSNLQTSRKARDLAHNWHVALVFHWQDLHRQVRIEGKIKPCTEQDRQRYFDLTSRRGRLASWTSPQSRVLPPGEGGDDGRAQLDARQAEVAKRFEDVAVVPMPATWGVLQVVPCRVEFWQGREDRLHDRFVYELAADQTWTVQRLAP